MNNNTHDYAAGASGRLIGVCSAVLLGGCSSFSSIISTPTVAKPTQAESAQRTGLVPVQWQAPHEAGRVKQDLLGVFNTPTLQPFIQQALRNNPNLQQTALRLKEQRLLSGQSRAAALPIVNLSSSAQRSGLETGAETTRYNLGLSANWEIDLWGKLADQAQAGQYDLKAAQADYQAARNSLSTQVVRHWISLVAQQHIIRIEQQRIKTLHAIEASSQARFQVGNSRLAPLASTRRAKVSAQVSLTQRQATLAQTKRAFNVLLGKTPTAPLQITGHLPQIRTPVANVPASVMGARPDLQAAYARMRSADLRTAVAYKQLLPGISLSPNYTQSGSQLSGLLSGNPAWQLLGQLTGNLFDGGIKKSNAQIQASGAQRAALAYRATLLTALQEVEDALNQEASTGQQLVAMQEADRQAHLSLISYQAQFRTGLAPLTEVLNAQQSTYDTQINLLEIRRSRLENRINLALALGLGLGSGI